MRIVVLLIFCALYTTIRPLLLTLPMLPLSSCKLLASLIPLDHVMTLARFRPASVKRIESLTASAFKELSRDVQAVPLHLIRAAAPRPDLFKLLRSVKDRFVEVELGRYDQQFEKVSIPLSAYLDWLEDGNSTVQGKQMYLAQSNLITEVCLHV